MQSSVKLPLSARIAAILGTMVGAGAGHFGVAPTFGGGALVPVTRGGFTPSAPKKKSGAMATARRLKRRAHHRAKMANIRRARA